MFFHVSYTHQPDTAVSIVQLLQETARLAGKLGILLEDRGPLPFPCQIWRGQTPALLRWYPRQAGTPPQVAASTPHTSAA